MKLVGGFLAGVIGAAFVFSACTSPQPSDLASDSSPHPVASWQTKMNELAALLAKALPYVHKNTLLTMDERQELAAIVKNFHDLSQSVNHEEGAPSQDVSFFKKASALEVELSEIQNQLKRGQDRQAQRRMANVTHYCIACHTMREGYAKEFSESFNQLAKSLTALERAEFCAATRQFDQAIVHYEQVLSDSEWAQKNPSAWNEAALRLLAILVRVKNDPNLTLEMVSRFFDARSYPKKYQSAARIWRREILRWQEQEKKSPMPVATSSVRLLLDSGARLNVTTGGGLIQDLRASRILHLLKSSNDHGHKEYQAWLHLSGEIAQRLQDLNVWENPRDYFSMCVRLKPKSSTGNRCLKSFILSIQREMNSRDQKSWPRSLVQEMEELKAL